MWAEEPDDHPPVPALLPEAGRPRRQEVTQAEAPAETASRTSDAEAVGQATPRSVSEAKPRWSPDREGRAPRARRTRPATAVSRRRGPRPTPADPVLCLQRAGARRATRRRTSPPASRMALLSWALIVRGVLWNEIGGHQPPALCALVSTDAGARWARSRSRLVAAVLAFRSDDPRSRRRHGTGEGRVRNGMVCYGGIQTRARLDGESMRVRFDGSARGLAGTPLDVIPPRRRFHSSLPPTCSAPSSAAYGSARTGARSWTPLTISPDAHRRAMAGRPPDQRPAGR